LNYRISKSGDKGGVVMPVIATRLGNKRSDEKRANEKEGE